ncbi:ribonuclease III [Azospira restricta]|uniref:Ribonuclease 3 n=1 Tax=Azospira restricta TaxID=404405 RepID=A0A974SN20_9RHOO|nr:ribonuclease III [Azospira restricta]QRJ62799.1 ribonuclease III [Azospira restricta]
MIPGRLEKALGHAFADPGLLQTALTHRSHSAPHNERLEFIGDSVLNCAVALELYRRFPALTEGEMSRLRANLVRQDTLHRIAESLALGDCLRLGEGELKSGGHRRPSILADAVEAIIGAVHLDAGFDAAAALVGRLYAAHLAGIVPGQQIKDPKTRLQEFLQGRRLALPQYVLLDTSGEAHAQNFRVACEVPALRLKTEGVGQSRRAAEQMAAERALEKLK